MNLGYTLFLERLVTNDSDMSNLLKIRPFHRAVNFSPEANFSAGLIRVGDEEHGLTHKYEIWFQKLRVAMRREADNFAKRGSASRLRLSSLEQTNRVGEFFERKLAAPGPDPVEELILREEDHRIKVLLACLHRVIGDCSRIRKDHRQKVEEIFIAYIMDGSSSMNSIREEIAPEIPKQRISEYWIPVRLGLIQAYNNFILGM